jgi:hypothetical protein
MIIALLRHMWTAPIGKRFFDVTIDWSAAVICPAFFGTEHCPLALMISDGPGPYHSGELDARDAWRGVPGFRW